MSMILYGILAILCINIGIQVLIARNIATIINESAYQLDLKLAEAITRAFEALPDQLGPALSENFEPPNMIQQLIGQVVAQRMNPDLKEIHSVRDSSGQFAPDTSS
jgi:hypothetical protein